MSVDRCIERVKNKKDVRLVQWLDVGEMSSSARSRLIRATGALPTTVFGKPWPTDWYPDQKMEMIERCAVLFVAVLGGPRTHDPALNELE